MSEAWREEIAALEARNCRAFVARDIATLERLWAPQLLVNSPVNRVHDRARVLELLQAGVIAHASFECAAEAMLREGDYVVVMGQERLRESADGPERERRYTHLWQRRGDSWQLLARHANFMASAAR